MTVERVRVGDVLQLERRAVDVDVTATYEEIGVRSFGNGIFHKEPVTGADLGRKRIFRVEPGDLVISNVFAWEGAIAIASQAEAGKVGSHRFMTFVPTDDRISTAWACWFFRSEPGLELIRTASPGSAGRNRTLAIDRFENIEMPLPTIDEQRRVAALLEAWSSHVEQMAGMTEERATRAVALFDAAVQRLLNADSASARQEPLGEVADVNPRPQRLDPDDTVTFVPMAAVDAATGEIRWPEARSANDIRAGYKQFRRHDVIFARITPCMQNGKSAIYSGETEFAYGSTEFHVVRPGPNVIPEWLHRVLRSRGFRAAAAERFTGTAGQQRVPAAFLREVRIPVPPIEVQEAVVERIDQLAQRSRSLTVLRARSKALQDALVPAVLNEAFETRASSPQ